MSSFSTSIFQSMGKSISCKIKGDQRNASMHFKNPSIANKYIHPHSQLQSSSSLGDKFSSKRRINNLHIFVKLIRNKCMNNLSISLYFDTVWPESICGNDNIAAKQKEVNWRLLKFQN